MGNNTPNESRYLYKINDDFELSQIRYYAVFDKTPFSEGAFRYCYRGKIKDEDDDECSNNLFPSGQCVVKVFKQKVARTTTDLNDEFKNSIYANKVARIFNNSDIGRLCYDLNFVIPCAASMQKYAGFNLFFFIPFENEDSMDKIKQDEWLAIEPLLTGRYERFVSNTNWTNPSIGNAIPAFMHWNWVYSRGEKVVSDVQGVEKDGYYQLTDPAVQSINQEYGLTDLGAYGLLVFLAKHRLNQYCRHLPWPSDSTINLLNSYHKTNNSRTTFSFEFKSDPRIRQFYLNIRNSVFR